MRDSLFGSSRTFSREGGTFVSRESGDIDSKNAVFEFICIIFSHLYCGIDFLYIFSGEPVDILITRLVLSVLASSSSFAAGRTSGKFKR